LVRWIRKRLSDEAGVPMKTTEASEQGRTSPMMRTEHKWRRALERAGVVFLDEEDECGPGVRLKKTAR
jgi:hypothetical protein